MIRSLAGQLESRDLVLIGNSGFLNKVDLAALSEVPAALVGLNAAPIIAAEKGLFLDYHVLFDYRFLDVKSELVLPHLDVKTICLWGDHIAGARAALPNHHIYFIPFLGYEGFSTFVPGGCFAGHTVAHVGLQIALFLRPRRVYLIGIDLNYGLQNPRFYQSKRGTDVELHVRSAQLYWLARGAGVLEDAGIPVRVVGDESYLRGYVASVSYSSLLNELREPSN